MTDLTRQDIDGQDDRNESLEETVTTGSHGSGLSQTRSSGGYSRLLRDWGFQSFLWTQFLAAFNDNVYKMIVSIMAVEIALSKDAGSRYLSIAGAVFVLPFLLFAGPAGQIADRFSKTRVLQFTKAFEIPVMLFGIVALVAHRIDLLLVVLFCLAAQANFFSPAKYGILPEIAGEEQLSRANGLIELSTFAAIVLGSSFGTFLFAYWKAEPMKMGLVLLGIAVTGSLFSLNIRKVPAADSREPFHLNPFHEVWVGARHLLRDRSMWLTVVGISFFWFVGALFQMAVLLLGSETLHSSEKQTGILITALAAGIGMGSLMAGKLSGDRVELGIVAVGSGLMGIFAVAVGMSSSYYWTLAWLTGLGFAGGLFIVPLNAYLQECAEPAEKGRILTTNNFVNMIGVVLASGLLSLLHDGLHVPAARLLILLGIISGLGTIWVTALLPGITLRFFLLTLLHILFRIRWVGAENIPRTGGGVLVSNHVSFADAVLVGGVTQRFIRFLMWQPYFDNRYFRPFFAVLKAIPLSTTNAKDALRALRGAREQVVNGKLVAIFPEGAVTRTGNLISFQRGVERLLTEDTPVVPVYIDGMWGHPLTTKGGGLFKSWSRFWRPRVTVYYGEPLRGLASAAELRRRVMELSARAMEMRKTPEYTLARRFVSVARKNFFQPAVADSTGKDLTYGKTLAASLLLGKWLDANCPEERAIGILLPASAGGAIANIGVTLAGRIVVNLNFTAGDEASRAAVARCGIRTVLSSGAFLEKVKIETGARVVLLEDILQGIGAMDLMRALLRPGLSTAAKLVRPEDPACVIFSSGSTGEPKGVDLSHAALIANVDTVLQVYEVGPSDCMLGSLPFFHAFGYTMTLWVPLLSGFRAAYHPNPMDAQMVGEMAGKHRATFLLTTPTFCMAYLRKCTESQFAHLRYVLAGAEKLRPELVQAFEKKFGITPLEGYGCTEMGPVVAVNRPDIPDQSPLQEGQRAGSVGRTLPGIAVKIVDPETLEPRPDGEEGLLLVKGPSMLTGYWNDPVRTAEAIRDGYYVTGDIARMDEDGFLYITGRLSRFSKIGGEMVPHLRIEEAIGIDGSCVVIGVPDSQRGERLAVLYTGEELEPAEMIERLRRAGLPALWIPKRESFYRVTAIPTLGTGKTDLRAVRQMALRLAEKPAKSRLAEKDA